MDQNLDHAAGVGQKFGSEFGSVRDPNLNFWITTAGDGLSDLGEYTHIFKNVYMCIRI